MRELSFKNVGLNYIQSEVNYESRKQRFRKKQSMEQFKELNLEYNNLIGKI